MPKPCSLELRERVVDAVESGASRREAADWFEVMVDEMIAPVVDELAADFPNADQLPEQSSQLEEA
jgi:hypothetical protein